MSQDQETAGVDTIWRGGGGGGTWMGSVTGTKVTVVIALCPEATALHRLPSPAVGSTKWISWDLIRLLGKSRGLVDRSCCRVSCVREMDDTALWFTQVTGSDDHAVYPSHVTGIRAQLTTPSTRVMLQGYMLS